MQQKHFVVQFQVHHQQGTGISINNVVSNNSK
jgi:hypothetical protein